jgi:hypothetical protein
MVRAAYQSMFVFLSALLLAALFAVAPSGDKEVAAFQKDLHQKFFTAAAQVIGGYDYAAPFQLVWATASDFYSESSQSALALLEPEQSFINLVMSFDRAYVENIQLAAAPFVLRPPTDDSLHNIVPMDENELLLDPYFNDDLAYLKINGGMVAGESIDIYQKSAADQPLPPPQPQVPPVVWMTIADSITGYPYCVGIFNGTINSYPGQCAEEYDTNVYEN